MNPIEHVWDQLGKRVRRSPNPPNTTEQLAQVPVEEWDNFPKMLCEGLFEACYDAA
jgi:hypothetical protein